MFMCSNGGKVNVRLPFENPEKFKCEVKKEQSHISES